MIDESGTAPDGTVTLGSSTLTLNLTYALTPGTAYTIVSNDDNDAVVGTFGNVTTNGGTITATYNSTVYTFRVYYTGGDGNDVVLVERQRPAHDDLRGGHGLEQSAARHHRGRKLAHARIRNGGPWRQCLYHDSGRHQRGR